MHQSRAQHATLQSFTLTAPSSSWLLPAIAAFSVYSNAHVSLLPDPGGEGGGGEGGGGDGDGGGGDGGGGEGSGGGGDGGNWKYALHLGVFASRAQSEAHLAKIFTVATPLLSLLYPSSVHMHCRCRMQRFLK